MAINQYVLLNNLHRTIIKFVSVNTTAPTDSTVTLSSLAHAAAGFSQSVSGTPLVPIIGISLSTPDGGMATTITRGGVPVVKLYGNYDLPQSEIGSLKIDQNQSSDIVVNMTSDGTLILDLRKDAGYTFGPDLGITGT